MVLRLVFSEMGEGLASAQVVNQERVGFFHLRSQAFDVVK